MTKFPKSGLSDCVIPHPSYCNKCLSFKAQWQQYVPLVVATKMSVFCPPNVFKCFMWFPQWTVIVSIYHINRLVFCYGDTLCSCETLHIQSKLTSSSAFLCEKKIYVIRLLIISCLLQWCFSVKRMKNQKLTWNQRCVFLVLRWADLLDFLAAVVLNNMRNSLTDHIRIWQQSLKGYFMFHSFYTSKDHNLFISFLSLLSFVVNI